MKYWVKIGESVLKRGAGMGKTRWKGEVRGGWDEGGEGKSDCGEEEGRAVVEGMRERERYGWECVTCRAITSYIPLLTISFSEVFLIISPIQFLSFFL